MNNQTTGHTVNNKPNELKMKIWFQPGTGIGLNGSKEVF